MRGGKTGAGGAINVWKKCQLAIQERVPAGPGAPDVFFYQVATDVVTKNNTANSKQNPPEPLFSEFVNNKNNDKDIKG
jgi:hypothetical protein